MNSHTETKVSTENNLELTRENVDKLVANNKVKLVDTDNTTGLELFCYVKCSNYDSTLLKRCRGVAFKGEKLVFEGFPYTVEYKLNDVDNITRVFNNCRVFESHEGTLLRVFNYDGKWYTTTHRKLDVYRSRWGCRDSFGKIFENALLHEVNRSDKLNFPKDSDNIVEDFYNTLDPDYQYMILLRNSKDNRIVCNEPLSEEPYLYHVGTFDLKGKLTLDDDISLPHAKEYKLHDVKELTNVVNNMNPYRVQGLILFSTTSNNQYKVYNREYLNLFKLRGNEPSIKFRYLQLRTNLQSSNELKKLYPNFSTHFDDYEECLYNIASGIYKAYVERFIQKQHRLVSPREYVIIKQCHGWHLDNKKTNKVSLDKVRDVMDLQQPQLLNQLIKDYKLFLKSQEQQENNEQ